MTTPENPTNNVTHYEFIHNVFGNFYHDTLSWISTELYPRFEYTIVSTYDKAVEYIVKQQELGQEADQPNLPALILNPTGDFNIADANTGAQQPWRFPNLSPGFINKIFQPLYQDENVLINVGFSRVKGEIELIMLLDSFYEYCDVRMLFLNFFAGLGRQVTPSIFNSFIILPNEIKNYLYSNDVTGETYILDWDNNGAEDRLIKTTNKTEKVFPLILMPEFKLTNLSDGSEKYGGTDKLDSWKLTATLEFECEFPTFLVLRTDYLVENIRWEFRYGSAYSTYEDFANEVPVNRRSFTTTWDSNLLVGETSELNLPEEATILKNQDLVFRTRYFHIISQEEVDSIEDVIINIPETVLDHQLIIINSKYGQMIHSAHYNISSDGNQLILIRDEVTLEKDMIIELYIYRYNWNEVILYTDNIITSNISEPTIVDITDDIYLETNTICQSNIISILQQDHRVTSLITINSDIISNLRLNYVPSQFTSFNPIETDEEILLTNDNINAESVSVSPVDISTTWNPASNETDEEILITNNGLNLEATFVSPTNVSTVWNRIDTDENIEVTSNNLHLETIQVL